MTRTANHRWIGPALAAALALGAVGAPRASAQATDRDSEGYRSTTTTVRSGDQVALDPGSVIPVTLNTELSSNNSQPGDTFTATVDTSREAYNHLMKGATVDGVVRRATPQSGSDPGTLELAFTRLKLSNGESYPISGTVTSLDSKDLQVGSNGVLKAVKTNKDQSLTYAGIGAGAGALVGILSGGKIRFEDLLLGGGLGYAAGQLLKGTQQVHDVDLKPGTPVGVLLGQRVLYHRGDPRRTTTSETVTTYRPGGVTVTHPNRVRYYMHNGRRWLYDPVTGLRKPVDAHTPSTTSDETSDRDSGSSTSHPMRYYSYQGHPYSLDTVTGKRTRLD